jgi:protein-glutamine gamma-glutamyltransferase
MSSSDTSKLIRTYHRSLLLTMLGSVLVFAIADLSPSFFIIGFIGSLIGYWYASQGPSNISRIAINALLAVVVVLGVTNALRGNFSVSSFAFFSLLLLILKLFDLRSPRDHGQILVLSLGLLIAAALTSSSMPTGFGVFFMGFVFIRSMMYFRIYALAVRPNAAIYNKPRAFTDIRSIQTVTGFVCSIVALLIFLAMPRSLGGNAFGQWGDVSVQLTSGFADDVQLGRPGRITNSSKPVLRLAVTDRNDLPMGSDSSRAIYLRGSVLTQYEAGRWVSHDDQSIPTTFRTRIVDPERSIPLVSDTSRAEWTQEYHITFDHPDQNYGYLFTPWKPLELKTLISRSRIGIDPETRMILLANQPVSSYRVRTSNPELQQFEVATDASPPLTSQIGVTPELRTLASQILTSASIDPNPDTRPRTQDIQAVRALETHLRTQYQYTLVSEPVPSGKDATEWFLFDRKEGHCEYYASALTLLSRSVGIPARVITGYVAAEYNDVTGTYIVRESNAHAWVEAMVAPGFWRTFDGTPQSDFHEIHEPDPTIFRSIAKFYEAIEHTWITAVIGYDSDKRSAVFGDIDPNLGLSNVANTLQNRLATGRTQLIRKALITSGMVFSITMLAGLTFILLGNLPAFQHIRDKLKSLISFRFINPSRDIQQHTSQQLIKAVHNQLHTIDAPCPQGLPLRSHLSSIEPSESNSTWTVLNEATDLLYNQQFKENPDASFVERAKALIAELR